MTHSPLPWSFSVESGDEVILDAAGNAVHTDTSYYPSGIATEDAQFIVESVNRVAALEADLAAIKSGDEVVLPASIAHAEAMHLVADRYLKSNRK